MAVKPFEQANFNLTSFSEAYNDLFDSTPKDVQIDLKDTNGNVTTKTIANRGKFKQQLWDDVGGALGQFNKTFYVDATNGNDTNDGSSTHPFKTLKKAISSAPSGSNATIILSPNQTHYIDSDIGIVHKNIHIEAQNAIIENVSFQLKINGTFYNATHGFFISNSFVFIHNGTIKTADRINDQNGNLLSRSIWEGIARRQDISFGALKLFRTNVNLGDTPLIRRSTGSFAVDLHINANTINNVGTNNDAPLIYNELGDFRFSAYNVTLGTKIDGTTNLTWSDLVKGVIKDSNGVPRNVISNIVF